MESKLREFRDSVRKVEVVEKVSVMTKSQLAEAVGVSLRTIYRWENGESYPSARQMAKLEMATGKKIQDIFPELFNQLA